jgi:hypothetical protein
MKQRVVLAVVLMTAAVAAGAQQAAPAAEAAKPVIDIAEKIKDFGVVAKGEKLNATFVVKNTGAAPLEITQVRPTCGCTVANFDMTIAPGATGKIDAEVDTAGFNGPISKAVLVFSNDPATPQVNLVIKADIRAFIEVLPRNLIRFNVLSGEPATEKVILLPGEDSQFKVLSVDAGGGPYQTAFRELPEAERVPERKGSQWEVSVTVPTTAPEGLLNHKLIVKTSEPKAAEVPLTVSGVVRPIVQVIPAELNFGQVRGDAPVGRNIILVNNRQGTQLELTKVEVDNPGFTAEVIPLQAGQRFQVAVTMQPGLAKGAQKATLKIATNDASKPTVSVPIQATVQ